MSCDCELTINHDDPDDVGHYDRKCQACDFQWRGLHCPHDNHQTPCPNCGLAEDISEVVKRIQAKLDIAFRELWNEKGLSMPQVKVQWRDGRPFCPCKKCAAWRKRIGDYYTVHEQHVLAERMKALGMKGVG